MKRLATLAAAALFAAPAALAQFTTATPNGTIGAGEYGTHVNGQNQGSSGGQTWYMTWDATNLYVGLTGANTAEAAVLYFDIHDPSAAGTNANGNTVGFNYDNTNFTTMPSRMDLVMYVKSGYREYRTANGSGGWSAQTSGFGAFGESGGTVREVSIPWSSFPGGTRPAQFAWFGYATSGGGFVYGEIPTENPEGNIGTAATAVRTFYVGDTSDGTASQPFETSVLPVELTTFTATATGTTALVRWTTASETGNAGFSLDRRLPSGAWATVATVAGRGTTAEATRYEERVEGLAAGRHTFRLVQRDLDGTATVAGTVELVVAPEGAVALAERRVGTAVVVGVTPRTAQALRVEAYDVAGRRVATLLDRVVDGTAEVALDGATLAPGVYVVRVSGAGVSASRTVVVR